jgi:hypothetical protein
LWINSRVDQRRARAPLMCRRSSAKTSHDGTRIRRLENPKKIFYDIRDNVELNQKMRMIKSWLHETLKFAALTKWVTVIKKDDFTQARSGDLQCVRLM